MLILPEEIILLALDDKSGELSELPERSLDFALAGALLTELALRGSVAFDDFFVTKIVRESTADKLLDSALALLPDTPHLTVQNSIARIAKKGGSWEDKIFSRLISYGTLSKRKLGLFAFSKGNSYDILDASAVARVKNKIRKIVMDENSEPNLRELVLIAIMNACELNGAVFSAGEIEKYLPRIEALAKKTVVGSSISRSISEIQNAILEVIAFSGL